MNKYLDDLFLYPKAWVDDDLNIVIVDFIETSDVINLAIGISADGVMRSA